ncbi:Polyketide synthase-nonribosomal peptide synthetase [Lachnellula suecica]|uniref:Polyketide synthase-nonribosomal peptide synthetase n=1 Tax=Lachnellula suecica TaxID=602035 RepID=A0A8T9CFQ6_9HELO|nr:Polyketide synthase-nonribosomal peptide synthetase [Lachnellula suecica]
MSKSHHMKSYFSPPIPNFPVKSLLLRVYQKKSPTEYLSSLSHVTSSARAHCYHRYRSRFPEGASSPSKLWKLLREPPDLAVKIPADRFNLDAFHHPDGTHFGTSDFFNVQLAEAEAMDPQQRLLLETVYKAVESAGLGLDHLQGSDTGVYVGVMTEDYADIARRDLSSFPKYTITGTARTMLANRISYFFDWHGPSITVDTACSSSLVAIHQAVQTPRNEESRVAIAAGAHLIFGPEAYITESSMRILSPSCRSRMWDAAADGFAKGEGVGVVVLKSLSHAIEDGDHIECIIRETGVNQDGRTKGMTMPSETAQAALIRDTYSRAGLDPRIRDERCQYFEAHGTGTAAGDPKEAEAVATAFFGLGGSASSDDILYVGSIKTVIGHTEGTAGIAGVIKASLALQHGVIPPNLHFERLNPAIEPFYTHLEVPTSAMPWPAVAVGQPRRTSVNSFGLGGTNCHAILENYEPSKKTSLSESMHSLPANYLLAEEKPEIKSFQSFLPLTFSATSERSLIAMVRNFSVYIKQNQYADLRDIAFTLSKRSTFSFKASFAALSALDLVCKIDQKLALLNENPSIPFAIRSSPTSSRVLGVFTGQGARWATMGRELLVSSHVFQNIIAGLEQSLGELPEADRSTWSLRDELLTQHPTSDFSDAAISQPLCTAIQIALVDLLSSAEIRFQAVIGHSSGEIAAAYAAGFISSHDAIRIAYYRGLFAKHASGADTQRGAMVAIGASYDEGMNLCSLPQFQGRVKLAANNSPSSVTLSGDADAVEEIKVILDRNKKFARILKTDTAYHSHHMIRCTDNYLHALKACDIRVRTPVADACSWYSSVYGGLQMNSSQQLGDQYWSNNMVRSVLFAQAVQSAFQSHGSFDLTIEVGPNMTLNAPVQQNILEISSFKVPYCGTMARGENDVEALAQTLGFAWSHIGLSGANLQGYDKANRGNGNAGTLLKNLPPYPWDHEREYWSESRASMLVRIRGGTRHEVLGSMIPDNVDGEIRWRNFLSPKEIPWMDGHVIQGQKVFPAAGYVVMAIEAALIMTGEKSVSLIEIHDLKVLRALVFDDNTTGIETMFTLTSITSKHEDEEEITASFASYSCLNKRAGNMTMMASGTVRVSLGMCSEALMPSRSPEDPTLRSVRTELLYASLADLGYVYTGDFKAMSSIRRKMDKASGLIANPFSVGPGNSLLIHPAVLDAMLQTMFAAHCSPFDGRLWSMHLPTGIRRITIDPARCGLNMGSKILFDAESAGSESDALSGDVDIFTENGSQPILKVHGLGFKPISEVTAADDTEIFSEAVWGVASPDGLAVSANDRATEGEVELSYLCERVAYFYYKNVLETVSAEEREHLNLASHHKRHLDAASEIVSQVSELRHPFAEAEWNLDSKGVIHEIMNRTPDNADFNIMRAVGENLPAFVRGETDILEHVTKDGILDDFYKHGLGLEVSQAWLGRMAGQICHRYPHMNILEIGAGTGGPTKRIIPELDRAFSSYTYTDASAAFFEDAREIFKDHSHRMNFKVLNVEKDVSKQGFAEHSYELVIAAKVLLANRNLEQTMHNIRKLVRPGGYLLLLEITNNDLLRTGFVTSILPGCWNGEEDGRRSTSTISLSEWDILLRQTGFSGVDSNTPQNDPLSFPTSVIVTQALDERVSLIREPLLLAGAESAIDHLLILGGKKPQVSRLVQGVIDLLGKYCIRVTRIESLEQLRGTDMCPMTTVISCTELDEPIFKSMTEKKWEALKLLFDLSRNVLWVTRGCRSDEPYSNMTVGLCRSLAYELPHLQIQLLDVVSLEELEADLLSEMLLRLQMRDFWDREGRCLGIVWSLEPEYILEKGRLKVLRMKPSQDRNNRYNSSRRLITEEVSPRLPIRIQQRGDAHFLTELPAKPSLLLTGAVPAAIHQVKIKHSMLSAIMVATQTRLFVCLGTTEIIGAQTTVIFLSDVNGSVVKVLEGHAVSCSPPSGQDADFLLAVGSHLLARQILSGVLPGEAVVINDPEPYLADTLRLQAAENQIELTLTTTNKRKQPGPWILIHPKSSQRAIRSALPRNPSLFVDFATTASSLQLGARIRECLPQSCEARTSQLYFGTRSGGTQPPSFLGPLEEAVAYARIALADLEDCSTTRSVPLKEVACRRKLPPTTIVDWTSPSPIYILVEPADSGNLFFNDRTYLLVGLTGDLGQSLCEWMDSKCQSQMAGGVVLPGGLSKNYVNVGNLFGFKVELSLGLTLTYFRDITKRDSVLSVYDQICSTMPRIGGVANGAMVLRDTSFSTMSYNDLQTVLMPKVEGTRYLDEILSANTLDFFILFSSLTAVLGNGGQANYSAANMFISSLAAQRRKRGLAASVMNVSGIFGVGYLSRVDDTKQKQMAKSTFRPISEQDFHQMFAEAVLGGGPGSGRDPEFTAGIQSIGASQDASWGKNPKFSYFVRNVKGAATVEANREVATSLRSQISLARTKKEVTTLVKASFSMKVKHSLLLDETDVMTPLLDLGIDSLVAVEFRSWFMKELAVDIPVLKILGGASISSLIALALEKLQPDLIPNVCTIEELAHAGSRNEKASSIDSSDTDESSGASVAATDPSTPAASEKGLSPLVKWTDIHKFWTG